MRGPKSQIQMLLNQMTGKILEGYLNLCFVNHRLDFELVRMFAVAARARDLLQCAVSRLALKMSMILGEVRTVL